MGYAPVLGNIYFSKEGGEAAAGESALARGAAAAGSPNPEDPNGDDKTKRGRLIGKLDGLTSDERQMIQDLLSSGKDVEIIPRSSEQGVKTPDFLVDGVKTELKTLNGTSLNTPVKRILEGFEQGAETVIIDARKTGITMQEAEKIIDRVIGKLGKLPGTIEIWTNEGIFVR